MRHRQPHAPDPRLALAELDEAADLQRLERREPQAHPATSSRAGSPHAVVADLHHPRAVLLRASGPRPASAARACRALRTASTSTDWASGSSSRRHADVLAARGELDAELGMRVAQARDLLAAASSPSRAPCGRAAAAARGAGRAARPAARRSRARAPRAAAARRWRRPAARRTGAGSRPRAPRARGRSAPAAGARAPAGTSRGARPRRAPTSCRASTAGRAPPRTAAGAAGGRRGSRRSSARPPRAGRRRASRRRAGRGSPRAPRARPSRRPSRSRGPRRSAWRAIGADSTVTCASREALEVEAEGARGAHAAARLVVAEDHRAVHRGEPADRLAQRGVEASEEPSASTRVSSSTNVSSASTRTTGPPLGRLRSGLTPQSPHPPTPDR